MELERLLSVVTIGYSKDADIWPIYFSLFSVYWPQCQLPCFFVADGPVPAIANVKTFSTGNNRSFSARLSLGLSKVKTPFVLILLHDDWFFSAPKAEDLIRFCEFMLSRKVVFLQLNKPSLKVKRSNFDNEFGSIAKGKHYRLNLQPAIWDREFLESALSGPVICSPWDFEVSFIDDPEKSSIALQARAFCPLGYSFPVMNGVEKGKITISSASFLQKNGIPMPDSRQIQSKKEFRENHRFENIEIPDFLRRFLKKIGRLLGKKYYSKT